MNPPIVLNATVFNPNTPEKVRDIIAGNIDSSARFRVDFGDPATGFGAGATHGNEGYFARIGDGMPALRATKTAAPRGIMASQILAIWSSGGKLLFQVAGYQPRYDYERSVIRTRNHNHVVQAWDIVEGKMVGVGTYADKGQAIRWLTRMKKFKSE